MKEKKEGNVCIKSQAVNCRLRRSEVYIQSRAVHLGFVVDRVSWGKFWKLFAFPLLFTIPPVFQIYLSPLLGCQIIQPMSTILQYRSIFEALLYTPHVTGLLVKKLTFYYYPSIYVRLWQTRLKRLIYNEILSDLCKSRTSTLRAFLLYLAIPSFWRQSWNFCLHIGMLSAFSGRLFIDIFIKFASNSVRS
jgi:hypothetical protein